MRRVLTAHCCSLLLLFAVLALHVCLHRAPHRTAGYPLRRVSPLRPQGLFLKLKTRNRCRGVATAAPRWRGVVLLAAGACPWGRTWASPFSKAPWRSQLQPSDLADPLRKARVAGAGRAAALAQQAAGSEGLCVPRALLLLLM